MTARKAVPVVYIGGHGHSGSTLLARTLGAIPGFCSVGELSYVWTRGVLRNESCGCGARFHDCGFWRQVGAEAFGGWDRVDCAELLKLRGTVARMRHLPLLAAPYTAPYFRRRLERYTQAVEYVYRAVQSVSGCGTIIDSSKYPAAAYPLRHMPGIDLKMIHLIRSSHGVAFSFMKKVSADGRPLMSPSRVAVEWIIYNFSFELLGALGIPSMRLRYEDFVARPPEQISHILDFLGRHRDPTELAFLGATSADLPADHSVAGNPMRLRSGREELTVDDKWRTLLPARERRIITAITAPGLLRYGYSPRHPHLLLSEP